MRVTIFQHLSDGSLVYDCTDELDLVMPERDDDYAEAVEALDAKGWHQVGGGAAPLFLLIQADGLNADRLEARILRREIADRVARELGYTSGPITGVTLINGINLSLDLGNWHDDVEPLRLRDLAAADLSEAVHDVMGIQQHIWHARRHGTLPDPAVFRPRFSDVVPVAKPAA